MEPSYYFSNQFSPRNASVNWDPQADLPEETLAFFEEYNKIPLFLRFGLGAEETQEQVVLLAEKMGWREDEKKAGEISRLVREIFTRGLKETELLSRIKERLGLSDQARRNFYQEIKKIAQLVQIIGQREFDLDFERSSIIKLLNDYPEIRLQKINYLHIYLEENELPVSSSVENWLRDYVFRTGSKKHSTIERSRYLFESENAKKLDSTERENLAILLKSYDEGYPLVFDKNEKRLLLEESRKIDDGWLASLKFFLGEVTASSSQVSMPKNSPPVYLKEKNLERKRVFPKKELKNVLDLSELV